MKLEEYEALFKVLADMGVPAHLGGWDCLMLVVPRVRGGENICEAYTQVGLKMGRSGASVERNIRTAAEASIDRLGASGIAEIYGSSLDPEKGVPTNMQLIVTAARKLDICLAKAGKSGVGK